MLYLGQLIGVCGKRTISISGIFWCDRVVKGEIDPVVQQAAGYADGVRRRRVQHAQLVGAQCECLTTDDDLAAAVCLPEDTQMVGNLCRQETLSKGLHVKKRI